MQLGTSNVRRAIAATYVVATLLGVVFLAVLAPGANVPHPTAVCRAGAAADGEFSCLGQTRPTVVTAEIAGTARAWWCQLQRSDAPSALPSIDRAECVEARIDQLRSELSEFDNGFFIPLYAGLSLIVLSWFVAAAPSRARVVVIGIALAGSTVMLVVADVRENRYALDVLDRANTQLVHALKGQPIALDADGGLGAHEAREASLVKWCTSAAWAALLALALFDCMREMRAVLSARAQWLSRFGHLPSVLLGGAAVLFALGSASGVGGNEIARPAQLLGLGMGAALAGMIAATVVTLAAAWSATYADATKA